MTALSVKDYMKLYETNTNKLAGKISDMMKHQDELSLGLSRQSIDMWVKTGTGVIEVDVKSGDIIRVKTISTKVFYERSEK